MAAQHMSFQEGMVVQSSMVECLVKKVYVKKFHIHHHGKHPSFVSHPCLQLDSLTGKLICRNSTKGCVLIQQMLLWPWNFHHRLKSKLSNLMAICTDPIPPSSWGLKNSFPGSNKIWFGGPNVVGFSKSYTVTFLTLLKNTSTSHTTAENIYWSRTAIS